jgi:CubicO group peptidase (beta-lactamase class C family)
MVRLLALFFLLGSAVAQTAPKTSLPAKVDSYLAPYLSGNNFSGAVLVAQRGRVLVRQGYGMANRELGVANTPETRFQVASISKPFTAAGVLLLVEQGKVALSDPVAKFVPDFPHGDQITVEHLLTHTSGIPDVNGAPAYNQLARFPQTPASLIAVFRDAPLDFPPGTKYAYSNSNYNLLARILEVVSGQDYGRYMREHVFTPLDLKATGHPANAADLIPQHASGYTPRGATGVENPPYLDWTVKTGNGSLYSTVDDLYAFHNAMVADKLLSRATREKIWTEGKGNRYGWFVRQRDGRLVISTNGTSPGFASVMDYYPADDLTVVVLSNISVTAVQSPIAGDLAAIARGEQREPPQVKPVAVAEKDLQRYAGEYQFGADFYRPNVKVRILVQDGALVFDWGNDFVTPLFPVARDEFMLRRYWARILFTPEGVVYRDDKDYKAPRLATSH